MAELTIDSAALVAEYGDYYINQGQNAGIIATLLRESFETRDEFTIVNTQDSLLRAVSATFQEVIQAFQRKWTPKGGIAFKTADIKLFPIKVDVEFYPDDLRHTWLGFLTKLEEQDRKQWPFVRWVVEVYLIDQVLQDLETKGVFSGKFVAPTVGTPGSAADSFDGIKTIINSKITAGTITPITTGAPSTTPGTWTGQLEGFLEAIPELYRDKHLRLRMSEVLKRRHRRGNRAKYNENYEVVGKEDMESFIDYPNARVVGLPSHVGSNKIWTSVAGNNIMAFKAGVNMSRFRLENIDRLVKAYTDFEIGIGFIMDELVWTNDQDLA